MVNEFDPLVGQWYAHRDKGQRFFVTAVSDEQGVVEVQHFDGDVEEFSFDEWGDLEIDSSEAPENWAGALDVGEQDDLGTDITDTTREDWADPARELRPSEQESPGAEPRSPGDDYGEGYMEERPLE